MARTHSPRLLLGLLPVTFLFGFDGGCWETETTPLEPPPAEECANLGEIACVAAIGCEPVYVTTCDGGEAPSGAQGQRDIACLDEDGTGCFAPPTECTESFAGCRPTEPPGCPALCEIYCPYGNVVDDAGCPTCSCNPPPGGCGSLDELSCIENPSCRPIYGASGGARRPGPGAEEVPCACPDCDPDSAGCPPCDCLVEPPPPDNFLGCEEIGPCEGLGEEECLSAPNCEPIYAGMAYPCDCEPCDPELGCGDCYCPEPPTEPSYAGCYEVPTDPCAQLAEEECIAVPGCAPAYAIEACDPMPCEGTGTGGDSLCAPPPPCDGEPIYAGCYSVPLDPCSELSEEECIAVPGCDPIYAATRCAAMPCAPGEVCDPPRCDGTGEPEYAGCAQSGPIGECRSDADCPGGYCEAFATCAGLGCPPPPPSMCVYPSCDDGTEVLCDMVPPTCAPGEILAARNGCWECVDPRNCGGNIPNHCEGLGEYECISVPGCEPVYEACDGGGAGAPCSPELGCDPPVEPPPCAGGFVGCVPALPPPPPPPADCRSDADCPNGFCQPLDGIAVCLYRNCDDGSEPLCEMLPPECGEGQTLAVVNHCWACLDARTCL